MHTRRPQPNLTHLYGRTEKNTKLDKGFEPNKVRIQARGHCRLKQAVWLRCPPPPKIKTDAIYFFSTDTAIRGRDSSVGIATRYGPDGQWIESRRRAGEIFRTRTDRPCGPPSLLYNGHRVFPGGNVARTRR